MYKTILCAATLLILACAATKKSPDIDTHYAGFIQIIYRPGGFYGGANPTTSPMVTINGDGEVTRTHRSLYGGTSSQTSFVAQDRVQELAKVIIDNGFFEMDDIYDCSPGDRECEESKHHYPPSVPLELEVIIDNYEKKVILTVYRENLVVDHPATLDTILKAIGELVAEAMGDPQP